MMESLQNRIDNKTKKAWRLELKNRRSALSILRRSEAKFSLLQLLPFLKEYQHILSFVSFGTEIDTHFLNLHFARSGRLYLPKICSDRLRSFKVVHLDQELVDNGNLKEPAPEKCLEISEKKIEIVLVPALGFDLRNHRIGYGKGFYDRFLHNNPHVKTIGLGFKEQLVPSLPTTSTDIALNKVCLF